MKFFSLLAVPIVCAGVATASACKPKPSSSLSSASPSASPSVVCQNIVQAPDFDPISDWHQLSGNIRPPSDNSWAQTTPCGDYDSCLQMTVDQNAMITLQTITYPYSGTYTASLQYKVINAGTGTGTLNFDLNPNDPGVSISDPSVTWLTYTTQFTANAGTSSLGINFSVNPDSPSTIQITDVQILACE
ncbi:hypothetical protein SEUCBS139899_009874 [Sporothrix eucalyptigena]